MTLEERIRMVRERIAQAAREAGRDPADITLEAATKVQTSDTIRQAIAAGITVCGDAPLLSKAVGNLLSNAALYAPEGAEIRVWCGLKQGCPCFVVDNTDVHIHENALPHLFEAFYREEGSRNRNTGGSGLGLYLVRSILEQHHASCSVKNTEKGVRATVRFPSD